MKRKRASRLAALALALLLAAAAFLPSAAPASASAGEKGQIIIRPNGQPLEPAGRFEAYQIFKGEIGREKEELDNLEWGSGVNHGTLVADMRSSSIPLGEGTFGSVFSKAYEEWFAQHVQELEEAEFVAQWLSQHASQPGTADDFARMAAKHLGSSKAVSIVNGSSWWIGGLDPGYYLVVDTYKNGDESHESDSSVSSYILEVLGSAEIDLKATIPTVEKKVEDQDGWLAGTGETVNYTLTGTLAENMNEYDIYVYKFKDTLSQGLTMDGNSLRVELYMRTVPETLMKTFAKGTDYTITYEAGDGGSHILTVAFEDLKKSIGETVVTPSSMAVRVSYTAHLNGDAVTGYDGNPNDVTLEYSNNPYSEGTGESIPDEVKTYTLALKIQKNDEKGEPLGSVRFKLKNSEGKYAAAEWIEKPADVDPDHPFAEMHPYWAITGWVDSPDEATEFITDGTGAFSMHGLDLGSYTLVETATKEGYELMQDLPFTIGVMEGSPDDDGIKTDGSLSDWLSLVVDETREDVEAADGVFSVNQAQLTLRNFPSPILPHTGGTGAAVVYTVSGIVILAGVCVVLFTMRGKKKKAD